MPDPLVNPPAPFAEPLTVSDGLAKRLLSNASIALLASIAARGIGMLLFILVSHRAGIAEAGAYALAMNYLALFLPISTLGLNDAVMRDIARDRRSVEVYLTNIGFMRLIGGFVSYGLLVAVVVGIFHYSADTQRFILLMGLSLVPESLSQLLQAIFTAHERQVLNAIAVLVINMTNLTLTWWMLRLGAALTTLAWVRLVSVSLGCVTSLILADKMIPWRRMKMARPEPAWMLARLRDYAPFTLMVLFYTAEWRIDTIILSASHTESQVARYYAAQLFLTSSLLLLDAYRLATLPSMSRLIQEGPKQLGDLHDRSFWYLLMMAVPFAIGIAMSAKHLLSILNPDFAAASGTLIVLMVVLLISFLNEPNGVLMIVVGQQRWLAALLGTSLLVNFVANLVLIPRFGGMGAAIARVFSATIFMLLNGSLVYHRIRHYRPLYKLPHVLLAAGYMTITLYGLQKIMPWWLAGAVSAGVYVSILLVVKAVPIRNIGTMRRI